MLLPTHPYKALLIPEVCLPRPLQHGRHPNRASRLLSRSDGSGGSTRCSAGFGSPAVYFTHHRLATLLLRGRRDQCGASMPGRLGPPTPPHPINMPARSPCPSRPGSSMSDVTCSCWQPGERLPRRRLRQPRQVAAAEAATGCAAGRGTAAGENTCAICQITRHCSWCRYQQASGLLRIAAPFCEPIRRAAAVQNAAQAPAEAMPCHPAKPSSLGGHLDTTCITPLLGVVPRTEAA